MLGPLTRSPRKNRISRDIPAASLETPLDNFMKSTDHGDNDGPSVFEYSDDGSYLHSSFRNIPELQINQIDADLDSDVSSILSPITHQRASTTKLQRTILKNIVFLIVVLPTFIAILAPSGASGSSNHVDRAKLIVDVLMLILIIWLIRYVNEWPWNWYNQIKTTRSKLQKRIKQQESFSNDIETNISVHSLLSNRKSHTQLQNLTPYAIGLCVLVPFMGASIMLISRRFIVLDESRQNLIFPNLNINLFIAWGLFRVFLICGEIIELYSFPKFTDTDSECSDIDKLPDLTTVRHFAPIGRKDSEASDVSFISIQSDGTTRLMEDYEAKLKLLESKTNELSVNLTELSSKQELETTRISQNFHKINDKLEHTQDKLGKKLYNFSANLLASSKARSEMGQAEIETNMLVNKRFKSSSMNNPDPSPLLKKPPLLNSSKLEVLREESNESLSLMNDGSQVPESSRNTFQYHQKASSKVDDSLQAVSPIQRSPMVKSSQPIRILESHCLLETTKEMNETYFSLHGFPFSSSIKHLITRSVVHKEESPRVNEIKGISQIESIGYDYGVKRNQDISLNNESKKYRSRLYLKYSQFQDLLYDNREDYAKMISKSICAYLPKSVLDQLHSDYNKLFDKIMAEWREISQSDSNDVIMYKLIVTYPLRILKLYVKLHLYVPKLFWDVLRERILLLYHHGIHRLHVNLEALLGLKIPDTAGRSVGMSGVTGGSEFTNDQSNYNVEFTDLDYLDNIINLYRAETPVTNETERY